MEETDVFGVRDAENNEVVFVSVMGLLGEYHAVALYLGSKSISQFWQLQNEPVAQMVADQLCDIRQIHAVFGKKSELMPEEKSVVRELGLAFKGAHAWPYFRSYRPGYLPWLIDAAEARLLLLALEQILEVAPRVKEDRRLVARKPDACTYLIRVPEQNGAGRVWRDERWECPPPAITFDLKIPKDLMDAVRGLPAGDQTFELDVAPSHMPVREKDERPQMPYLMLTVDSDSFFILGMELLMVKTSVEEMWTQVPAKFLETIGRNGIRPKTVAIGRPWVMLVMQAVCKELGIALEFDQELRAVAEARQGLERFGVR
jgi:hypothetical protein